MANVVTPERAPPSSAPPQTRQDDPESPSHGNLRAPNKRRQRDPNRANPIGGDTPTTRHLAVSEAVKQRIQAAQKATRTRHNIISDLAAAIDNCLGQYHDPLQLTIAKELQEKLLTAINATVDTPASAGSDTDTSHRSWADVARTPKNPAPPNRGAAKAKTVAVPTAAPKIPQPPPDNRILISVSAEARLQQASPFAARKAIVEAVGNGITLADIPHAKTTKTGWAITPRNDQIRNGLMEQVPRELMIRAVDGQDARLPERWVNYALQGVTSSYRNFAGQSIPITNNMVFDEAFSQTGTYPTSCRASRHGTQEDGRITWIVSFTSPVRAFRLFGQSEYAKVIRKNPPITLHNPGCLGYCKIANCTRATRCHKCSKTIASHEGPHGDNCTDTPRCANCHGPFEASHPSCPAAPSRVNGRIIRPTKKLLANIRQAGQRAAAAAAATNAPADTPVMSVEIDMGDITPQDNHRANNTGEKRGRQAEETRRPGLPNEQSTPQDSSRPRRQAAPTQSFNLARMSARSVQPRGSGHHTDPSSTEHADTELSTDSSN